MLLVPDTLDSHSMLVLIVPLAVPGDEPKAGPGQQAALALSPHATTDGVTH